MLPNTSRHKAEYLVRRPFWALLLSILCRPPLLVTYLTFSQGRFLAYHPESSPPLYASFGRSLSHSHIVFEEYFPHGIGWRQKSNLHPLQWFTDSTQVLMYLLMCLVDSRKLDVFKLAELVIVYRGGTIERWCSLWWNGLQETCGPWMQTMSTNTATVSQAKSGTVRSTTDRWTPSRTDLYDQIRSQSFT
jgi:hypothetical protein